MLIRLTSGGKDSRPWSGHGPFCYDGPMHSDNGSHCIRRIVSGGQTGVDRGALDAAGELGIDRGGWCPRGRLAEDGAIPPEYPLQESDSSQYSVRTEQNVVDSDGTLIVYRGDLSGGTKLTRRMALKHGRPLLLVDLVAETSLDEVTRWLRAEAIEVLNVAGPRESTCPGICAEARQFVRHLLDDC